MIKKYDCIVVGGGHAGIEAACACSRTGAKTLLITYKIDDIGVMSCNPSIGGLGKGHIVREIDALGGIMGRAIDAAGIHFRMLNASKGKAVEGNRAQADRDLYKQNALKFLKENNNLDLMEDEVIDILNENNQITGVLTKNNGQIDANSVVMTTGTFLNGIMHCGDIKTEGGRIGDAACTTLSLVLKRLGFELKRLKTGTPARLSLKSLDLSKTEIQESDNPAVPFSYLNKEIGKREFINCYITHTNQCTHDIIKCNVDRSPLFNGQIEGIGPRYCPSIEDKIVKFPHHETHHVFLEPEGVNSDVVYPNGISTSLPQDVQEKLIRSIKGCENAKILQWGYAIEYDCIDARVLKHTLESKDINGLFFAGQINGSSGYEEAAGQGIVAGINAGLKAQGCKEEFILSRAESMIGVLIDDITLNGVDEPYRIFTARAEFRLLIRSDNADLRLTPYAIKLDIVDEKRKKIFEEKFKNLTEYRKLFDNTYFTKKDFIRIGIENSWERKSVSEILKDENYNSILSQLYDRWNNLDKDIIETLRIENIYSGYIERAKKDIDTMKKDEDLKIRDDINYDEIQSLTNELRQKLKKVRPANILQASKINGMTPAGIIALLRYIKK